MKTHYEFRRDLFCWLILRHVWLFVRAFLVVLNTRAAAARLTMIIVACIVRSLSPP